MKDFRIRSRSEGSGAEAKHFADELTLKQKLIRVFFHVFRQFDDTYYTGFAAQIAYFFFMASVPTLIVVSQLMGIFDVSLDFIREWISRHIDSSISSFVMGLFSASSVRFANTVMIIVALWAASSLEFSLTRLNAYVMTEGRFRFNYWSERFKAIPTAFLTLATVAVTLILYVYGDELTKQLVTSSLLLKFMFAIKFPLVVSMFFIMIIMSYYSISRIRVPLKCIIPGAVFATVGIAVITVFYGFYIEFIADYNILYGSFANIVALLLWFYLISWVLCIGMMVNKAWDAVFARDLLTESKIREYLLAVPIYTPEAVDRMFYSPDDNFNPETESIAVKYSRKYDPGYEAELYREKQAMEELRAIQEKAKELYDKQKKD